jgi:hypothetical protein
VLDTTQGTQTLLEMAEATHARGGIYSVPLEVRRMIWYEVLVPIQPVDVCYSTNLSQHPDSQGKPQAEAIKSPILAPSILRVSKIIHEETEEVLYSFNTFMFQGSSTIDDLILFLQSTSELAYRRLIRHIIVSCLCVAAKELERPIDFLTGCHGLKSLTMINLPLQHGRIPKTVQTWICGLRIDAIKFPGVPPENSFAITQIIKGNGTERKRGQVQKAREDRDLKVNHLLQDKQDACSVIHSGCSMGGDGA